jgi:hypothetical protein
MTKFKKTAGAATKYLVIRISSLIRHSPFVIRHYTPTQRRDL